MLRKLGPSHQCVLPKDSDSCLPILPPQSGILRRLYRSLRKLLIVSQTNKKSAQFFRSHYAVISEKKRHIHSQYWYVIHPFSQFFMYFEFTMCIVWGLAFFHESFLIAFYRKINNKELLPILIEILLFLNVVVNFLSGYLIFKTKEIILEPKKIMKHYLKTYFLIDFFGNLPYKLICQTLQITDERTLICTSCLKFLKFVRITTMLKYLRQVTLTFGAGDTAHEIICLSVLTFYFLHWLACLAYIIPKINYLNNGTLSKSSWLIKAEIEPWRDNKARKYIQCFQCVMCHFYNAGIGMYSTKDVQEQLFLSIILLLGAIYITYLIVKVLDLMYSANAAESKYEELMYHLKEFMHDKKLPSHLRYRLLLYYENRFHKRYFKETAILLTLSEHLRQELFLHSCKSLVDKAKIFKGLSRSAIGTVIGCLTQEVFLPNDVIKKAGDTIQNIYFISYGTVALMLADGREVEHLEDGDHFGDLTLIVPSKDFSTLINIISLETTETFKLERRHIRHCILSDETLTKRMEKNAKEQLVKILRKEDEVPEMYDRKDVLHDLRRGRILEKPKKRKVWKST